MAYSKKQLTAYRVARKLRGVKGAPMVTVQQEFWRYRQWARNVVRTELEAHIRGRQRKPQGFGAGVGYTRLIEIWPDGKVRAWPSGGGRSDVVGRVYKDVVILHRKKAPRWLLNWAKYRNDVYVLNGISRRALRAHLVQAHLIQGKLR